MRSRTLADLAVIMSKDSPRAHDLPASDEQEESGQRSPQCHHLAYHYHEWLAQLYKSREVNAQTLHMDE